MHPSPAFAWNDEAAVLAFAADAGFAKIFAQTSDGPRVAHTAILIEDRRLLFHLARGNALTGHLDGMTALAVIDGPHGYISPGWYETPDQVPTWNYVAAEIEGSVRQLPAGELPDLLDRLSGRNEAQLSSKAPWTRASITSGTFEKLLGGIVGFELAIADVRGTAKLSQNKSPATRGMVADELESRGDEVLARWMKGWS